MKQGKMTVFFVCLVALVAIGATAFASNTDTVGVSVTVQNNDPTIDRVDTKGAEDPTAFTTTTIGAVTFDVTDANGRDDINLANTYVNFTNGADIYQSTTCVDAGGSGNYMNISCTGADFDYYATAGTWTITVYVEDDGAVSDTDSSETMTYNEGIHVRINNKNVTFGTVGKGSNDNANTNAPAVNFENGGNVNIDTAITGANITDGGSNSIPAGQFSIDETNADTTGEQALTTSSADFSETGGIAPQASWPVYFWLDVPSDQTPATYDTGVWTVTASKT